MTFLLRNGLPRPLPRGYRRRDVLKLQVLLQVTILELSRKMHAPATNAAPLPPMVRYVRRRATWLARYLLHVTLGVSMPAIARANGVSKQAVHRAVRQVEDRREADAFIDRICTLMEAAIAQGEIR